MKKLISSAIAIAAAISLCIPAGAVDKTSSAKVLAVKNEYGLSTEATDFLVAHNVDLSVFDAAPACYASAANDHSAPLSMDSAVLSLILEAEAYGFTDEQIQQYVDGLVHSDPIVVSEDGNSTYAVTNPPYSTFNSAGPGFEVRSNDGFCTATAVATLPEARNVLVVNSSGKEQGSSNAYIFYTVYANGWGIDVGLSYNHGSVDGNGWRGFYTPDKEGMKCDRKIPELTTGSKVYFHANIESSGYLRFRVLDASNFSKTYYDLSYYVGSHGINRTNAVINRQITMTSNINNYTNGSYIRNASFSDAYLYTASGSYSKTNASNTNPLYRGLLRFGTKQLATVNSYTPWYEENISISFS